MSTEALSKGVPVEWNRTPAGRTLPFHFNLIVRDELTAQELDWWYRRIADDPFSASGQEELRTILTGASWRWVQFEQWYEYFHGIEYFPHMWNGLEVLPDPPQDTTTQTLKAFNALSWDARKLGDDVGITTNARGQTITDFDFKRRTGLRGNKLSAALRALSDAGFVDTQISVGDRLHSVKNDDLREALAQRDLPKSGKKSDLVERLVANVPEQELLALLPPNSRRDAIRTHPIRALCSDEHFLRFEDKRLALLHHTVRFAVSTTNNISEYKGYGFPLKALHTDDNCPICTQRAAGRIDPNTGPYPPFHPGCRCSLTVAFEDGDGVEVSPPGVSRTPRTEGQSSSRAGGCCGCTAMLTMGSLSMIGGILWALLH